MPEMRCRNVASKISQFIKTDLENPFDQIGQDDVLINAEKFMDRLQAVDTAATSSVDQVSNDLDHHLVAR